MQLSWKMVQVRLAEEWAGCSVRREKPAATNTEL